MVITKPKHLSVPTSCFPSSSGAHWTRRWKKSGLLEHLRGNGSSNHKEYIEFWRYIMSSYKSIRKKNDKSTSIASSKKRKYKWLFKMKWCSPNKTSGLLSQYCWLEVHPPSKAVFAQLSQGPVPLGWPNSHHKSVHKELGTLVHAYNPSNSEV